MYNIFSLLYSGNKFLEFISLSLLESLLYKPNDSTIDKRNRKDLLLPSERMVNKEQSYCRLGSSEYHDKIVTHMIHPCAQKKCIVWNQKKKKRGLMNYASNKGSKQKNPSFEGQKEKYERSWKHTYTIQADIITLSLHEGLQRQAHQLGAKGKQKISSISILWCIMESRYFVKNK